MDHLPTPSDTDLERLFELRPGTLAEALARMFEALPAGICISDDDGRLLFVNEPMARMFGRPVGSMTGQRIADWLERSEGEELRAADRAAAGHVVAQSCFHLLKVAGRSRGFQVTRRSLQRLRDDAPALCCSIWREPAAELPAVGPARNSDPPVGPPFGGAAGKPASGPADPAEPIGRALFDDQLRRELDLSRREQREFALVAIAIDWPDGADRLARLEMLQRLEQLLRANIRAMDSSFRVAGNLFFMLLSGVGLATAHARVEALRRQCASEIAADGAGLGRFGISIGVASYPHTARDGDEIVRAAEMALGTAKQRGGNQVALARIAFDGS